MDPAIVRSSEDDLMDILLATMHTGGMHITADLSSHVYTYIYMYTREICFRIEPRRPPLNANADFLRNCSCTQLGRLVD